MSRAVVFDRYGPPDVLRVVDAAPPEPGPGQVRVRVEAAGVQPFDCLFRGGTTDAWLPARFPQRLGNEFAGVVDAVGDGAGPYAVGAEVLGWAGLSAYAEHVVVGADQIVAKPAGMPWTAAGVLSASGQTAATALDELDVTARDTVLIHAAAGGVGTFAVQLARARGAAVIGTASTANHDYLRSLGAIPVAYGDGLTERIRALAPGGVDAALDAAGTREAMLASRELVAAADRRVTTVFRAGAEEPGIRRISTDRSIARLAGLAAEYAQGRLRATIQRAYPLEEAAEAHRAVETGHVRGKVVLTT
jgi:enoyl reductase